MLATDPEQTIAALRTLLKAEGHGGVVNLQRNNAYSFYDEDVIVRAIDAMEEKLMFSSILDKPNPLEKFAMLVLLKSAGLA